MRPVKNFLFRSVLSCMWLLCAHMVVSQELGGQPNPPKWPSTVFVFDPSDPASVIESAVNKAFSVNGGQTPDNNGQFTDNRYAFLFKPGQYDVEVPVGFYTQVLGLGNQPQDVVFTSAKGVYCTEGSLSVSPGALDTFWRSAENFQTNANFVWTKTKGMLWAASQASPLRRVVVKENLMLYQFRSGDRAAGFASGGFLGNSQVTGFINSGSQQQYISRNVDVAAWQNGVWNMVFVGTPNAPKAHCGANPKLCVSPYVVQDTTPVIAEKPFISVDSAGKYHLNIPGPSTETTGSNFSSGASVDFEDVFVATDTDSSSTINKALIQGLHVVLSPGIYNLESALEVTHDNQVVLGLGLATLVSANGDSVIRVANHIHGVRVAGVLLQAGPKPTDVLLQWGNTTTAGDATNPGLLADVFARVCGPDSNAQARVMIEINQGHVIGDNLWLWRADHLKGGGLVSNGTCPCDHGMVINSDDVTMYGLASEHQLKDLVVWNGDRGQSYFFQAEYPYDVTQANFGDKNYVAYRVDSQVTKHKSFGAGVYHFFRDNPVTVQTGISCPVDLEKSFVFPLAVFLNGKGVMKHIINDRGKETKKRAPAPGGGPAGASPVWFCEGTEKYDMRHMNVTSGKCKVGDPVTCPGTTLGCAGNSCCADGTTCPSANDLFQCCPKPKTEDCTKGASFEVL